MDCPDCDEPLGRGGRFCKACGWDADLEDAPDGYLDGVDLPDTFSDADYRAALARDGLGPADPAEGRRRLGALLVVAALVVALLLLLLR